MKQTQLHEPAHTHPNTYLFLREEVITSIHQRSRIGTPNILYLSQLLYQPMRQKNRSRSDSQNSTPSNVPSNTHKQTPTNRLFIGNINPNMDPQELKTELEQFGQIDNFFVKPPVQGKDSTFGFVSMASIQVAEQVINTLYGRKIADRSLYVKYAYPKPEQSQNGRTHYKVQKEREERRSRDEGDKKFRGDKNNRNTGDRDKSPNFNEEKPRFREQKGGSRERFNPERRPKNVEGNQGKKNFQENCGYRKKEYDSKPQKASLEETQIQLKPENNAQRTVEEFDY